MTGLPVKGVPGSFFTEDPEIKMQDIFGEIHPKGQQTDTAPPDVAREKTDPKATAAEEINSNLGQEEGLLAEYPSNPVDARPPPVPNVSPARKPSSLSSRHYVKLLSARAPRSLGEPFAPGRLNCHIHPFFLGLFLLSDDMEPFLFVEGDIFEPGIMFWLKMKRTKLEGL